MKTRLLHIICHLALLALHSCSHDVFDRGKDNPDLSVSEAREYFENNATDLRYNELVYSYTPTKADDNIVPLWDKARHGTTPNSEVVMIPILEAGKIKGLLTSTLFGRKRGTTDNVKVESHLVIQRYNTSGKMRRFITTVVGISDDAKANPYIFTGDRTKFQGFMLISDETGKCWDVFYYMGGRRFKMQIGNYTAEEKRKNKHLQMSVGFSFIETSVAVKGGGGHLSGEDGDSYCYNCHSLTNFDSGVCAICGAEPEEIGGGEAYFFCKGCGKLVESCICEHEPTPDPDPENPNEEACPLCGSRYCNGECSDLGSGERGGGDEPAPPSPEQPQDLYTVVIAEPVGGTVTGAGEYKKGSTATISATTASGYLFAGWNGDYSGLDNPASFTVNDDMTIYAKFYEEDSECGRLVKNLESLPYMLRCREKIWSGTGLTEYGYIRTSGSIEELTGRDNAIAIPDMPNTIELAHTHIDVIHPSIDDLKSVYRRYYKGCISDYENFKYIIISPKYFVILKIEDIDRLDVLIRDSLIIKKVHTDDNKYRYDLAQSATEVYNRCVPCSGHNVEGYFKCFMDFLDNYDTGLSVSLYRTDGDTGELTYKKLKNKEDVDNLLMKINICSNN